MSHGQPELLYVDPDVPRHREHCDWCGGPLERQVWWCLWRDGETHCCSQVCLQYAVVIGRATRGLGL